MRNRALRRLANGARGIDGALRNADLPAEAGQAEKGSLDTEDDLLVLAVEAKVGCEQALFGCVPGVPAAPEVEEQPAQIQRGNDLLQIRAEETVGATSLGAGNA